MVLREKSQEETVEWGVRDKKNPNDAAIQSMEDMMGTDHRKWGDTFFSGMLGPGNDNKIAELQLPDNPFQEKSHALPSPLKTPPALRKSSASDAGSEVSKLSRPEKQFDAAGVMSKLQPAMLNQLSSTMKKVLIATRIVIYNVTYYGSTSHWLSPFIPLLWFM